MGNCCACLKVTFRKETPGHNSAPSPPCCECPKLLVQKVITPECCNLPRSLQKCLGFEQVKFNPLEPPPIKLPATHVPTDGELAFPLRDHKYPIIWLLGGPSSGRRTQGRMLSAHYNYMYIRWESLLSSQMPIGASHDVRMIRSDEKLNRPPKDYMTQVKKEMARGMYLYQGFFIQGCPYNVEDAHEFIRTIGDVFMILYLEVNMADLRARSEGYGEVPRLNRYYSTQGKEQFEKDFDQWINSTQPILTAFPRKVVQLNGSENSDVIYNKAINCIDYVLRKTGLRAPARSKEHRRRKVKSSVLTIVNDGPNQEHLGPPLSSSIPLLTSEISRMGRFNSDPPPGSLPVGNTAFPLGRSMSIDLGRSTESQRNSLN